MKSAEEILLKNDVSIDRWPDTKLLILKAMEEYANQLKSSSSIEVEPSANDIIKNYCQFSPSKKRQENFSREEVVSIIRYASQYKPSTPVTEVEEELIIHGLEEGLGEYQLLVSDLKRKLNGIIPAIKLHQDKYLNHPQVFNALSMLITKIESELKTNHD